MRLRDDFRNTNSLYSALVHSDSFVNPIMKQGIDASDVFAVASKYNNSVNSFLDKLSNKGTVAAALFVYELNQDLDEKKDKGLAFTLDDLIQIVGDIRTKVWRGDLAFNGRKELFQADMDDVEILCRSLKWDYDEAERSFDGAEALLSAVHKYNGLDKEVTDVGKTIMGNLNVYRSRVFDRMTCER